MTAVRRPISIEPSKTGTRGPRPILAWLRPSDAPPLAPPPRRLRYEMCIVLCVRAPSWKDAVLSRFIADDRRMAEGRERAEAVMRAIVDAGLTLRVKRHLGRDGAKLLLAFVTAGDERMARQSQRRAVERWLTEEGGMGLASTHGDQLIMQRRAKQPTMRVIRVGGLHYFAPVDPTPGSAGSNSGGGGSSGGGGDMPGSSADADAAPAAAKFSAATRVELVHHALMSPTTQVSRHGRGGYG